MGEASIPKSHDSTTAAIEAFRRGYVAVPIRKGSKAPLGRMWQHTRWDREEDIRKGFGEAAGAGAPGIGLLTGEPSGGLIDVDLDHPKALRLRDLLLPPTPMQTGRAGRPRSHYWYLVRDHLPSSRRYKMPDQSTSIELRGGGAQTVIPPSVWWPKEVRGQRRGPAELYRWEGEPWGGETGPAVVDGRRLAIQVALVGMGAVLLERWPDIGGRHDAYLALAGGLLRFGDGVHPYWEKNLPVLIEAICDATNDKESRVAEVLGSTVTRLREGKKAVGITRLGELIGADHAEQARRMAKEVESLGGWTGNPIVRLEEAGPGTAAGDGEALVSSLPPEQRSPMEERISSWAAVDLDPYLSGEVSPPAPTILVREDGQGLMYRGRVNSLFGLSESAKTFIALFACMQEIGKGERVVFIDLEDGPDGTLSRALLLGAAHDDLRNQFRYVHPEGPIADMQRYRYGSNPTEEGILARGTFQALLEAFDPTLIVADGMTALYGLHGHDTNEATATDVITTWLKGLCRNGRTTVIVIDHTGKAGGAGSSPIGAHHKVAMVQGTALRVDVVDRPMPGVLGQLWLIVYKDRPGQVRAVSTKAREQVAGVVWLDSREPELSKMWIDVPDPDQVLVGDSAAMERRLAQIAAQEEVNTAVVALFGGDLDRELMTRDMMEGTGCSQDQAYTAQQALIERGVLQVRDQSRSHRTYGLDPGLSGITPLRADPDGAA